ncbi:MAG: NADH-quinone oxidoreductase subunit L [Caldilineaceae bacterium]|nr:NADH-quinone oxidoreductase subunit L [Caldilineaceae bacterium]
MLNLAWLLFTLPAVGALINLLIGHRLNRQTIGIIASGAVILSFLVAVGVWISLLTRGAEERVVTIHLWDWITIGSFQANAALLLDPLSTTMALIITGVGSLIHLYSMSYMDHEERFQRFFIYLNFFIFAMLILVLSDNFVGMFVGWEGVGLASYLLIGFWFDRRDDSYGYYADAGKKAFLVNRIGDFGMILAIVALWSTLGTVTFLEVFENAETGLAVGVANVVCLLLLLGASGKSAQIPLYVWLPDAMAGPTPVSALIHAATMVTAGIYMIARTNTLWHIAEGAATTAAWIGALTAFFAATIALVQTDLKKILAYSTISQLGYMMLGVGVGAYGAAVFHLLTHAFFKALLFLAAGSVMHGLHGELDIRKMGGLRNKMPATFRTFLIGAAALAGTPLLSGFFSKDAILAATLAHQPILYIIGIITALLTAFYSARAVIVPFFGKPRDKHLYDHAHESPPLMTTPLWILAALSVVAGLINLPYVLTLEYWLEPALGHHEAPSLMVELTAFLLSTLAWAAGLVLAYGLYQANEAWAKRLVEPFKPLQPLVENKWYVDEFYMTVIVNPLREVANWFAKTVDKLGIDGIVNGIGKGSLQLGEQARYLQNGAVPTYALSIFIGVAVVIAYFVFGA